MKKLNWLQRIKFWKLNLLNSRKWCTHCGTEMFMGLGYRGWDKHRWTCPYNCHKKGES